MTNREISSSDNTEKRPNELLLRVDAAAEAVLSHVTFSDPALRQVAQTFQITMISNLKDEFTRKFAEMRSALAELPNTEAECNRYVSALASLYCVEASLKNRCNSHLH